MKTSQSFVFENEDDEEEEEGEKIEGKKCFIDCSDMISRKTLEMLYVISISSCKLFQFP